VPGHLAIRKIQERTTSPYPQKTNSVPHKKCWLGIAHGREHGKTKTCARGEGSVFIETIKGGERVARGGGKGGGGGGGEKDPITGVVA
jgi:hypothetical protein